MRSSFRTLTVLAGLIAFAAPAAQAQMGSGNGPSTIALSAKKNEVLTLSLNGTTALTNTNLAASQALGSVTATVGWTLSSSRSNVTLVGWFASNSSAMSDATSPTNAIASADVLATCSATKGVACGGNSGFSEPSAAPGALSGASKLLWTSDNISGSNRIDSADITLGLSIDATAAAALPAGTYTGILNLRAFAQ